jgi:hypothetical protein
MRRVRVTFWALVVVTIVAIGTLTQAIEWPDGPLAGATVAISGAIALTATAFAARILAVLGRQP